MCVYIFCVLHERWFDRTSVESVTIVRYAQLPRYEGSPWYKNIHALLCTRQLNTGQY